MRKLDLYDILTRVSSSLVATFPFANQLVEYLRKLSAIWSRADVDDATDSSDLDGDDA